MDPTSRPRILFVYYSYTGQTLRVVEAMMAALSERGFEADRAAIEFTDARYAGRFATFPLRHVYRDLFSMLLPQLRRGTGQIRIPERAGARDFDLVCIGSPTWWLTTCMPIRSFLKSEHAGRLLEGKRFVAFVVCRRYWRNNLKTVRKLGAKRRAEYRGGIHFRYPGGQLRSLLSLASYLATGEYRDRYLGVRVPRTNLRPEQLDAARAFASELADNLEPTRHSHRVDA